MNRRNFLAALVSAIVGSRVFAKWRVSREPESPLIGYFIRSLNLPPSPRDTLRLVRIAKPVAMGGAYDPSDGSIGLGRCPSMEFEFVPARVSGAGVYIDDTPRNRGLLRDAPHMAWKTPGGRWLVLRRSDVLT